MPLTVAIFFLRGRKRAIVCRVLFLNFNKYCPLKNSTVCWISLQIGISLLFLEFERGKHYFSCEIDFSKSLPFFLRTMFHKLSFNYFSLLPLQCSMYFLLRKPCVSCICRDILEANWWISAAWQCLDCTDVCRQGLVIDVWQRVSFLNWLNSSNLVMWLFSDHSLFNGDTLQ